MTKVVIDTNVLVSALLNQHGTEAAVLILIRNGPLTWYVTEAILAEYRTTLYRSKFDSLDRQKIAALLRLASSAEMTIVTKTLAHSPDESDNRFYECAQAAQADYLVTGNRKHFPKDLPPTRIVNARELLDALK